MPEVRLRGDLSGVGTVPLAALATDGSGTVERPFNAETPVRRIASPVLLESICIQSFKSYEDETATFRPLTVLIGPNGSGKTSVLQAVEFLGGVVRGTLQDHLESRSWSYSDLPRLLGLNQQFAFRSTVTLRRGLKLDWSVRFGTRRRPGIAAETVTSGDGGSVFMERKGRTMSRVDAATGEEESVKQTLTSSWLSTIDAADRKRFPELLELAEWARGIRPYVTLDTEVLRSPSRRTSTGIGSRGEYLAGFLRYLRDRDTRRFNTVIRDVKTHYPHLTGITIRQVRAGWNRIEVEETWGGDAVHFTASQVSDGLLRLIAVAALRQVRDPPSVVMIDEIENGLHPHLLGGLVTMLRRLSREGRTQVIATSHNPIALNYITDPQSVLVVTRDTRGTSAITPLANTDGFRRLGDHLDPGELWYNLGEAGLLRRTSRKGKR